MELIQNNLTNLNPEIGKKWKKLSGDERLKRNRERNKLHARKTRERKKNQSIALQTRINELKDEGKRLRQMVDERYVSSSLLGLGQLSLEKAGDVITLQLSTSICNDYYSTIFSEKPFSGDFNEHRSKIGRVRRSGKYTPQEREKTRRERNRVHAKKTRDKKKNLLEISEKLITEMENESRSLRSYLFKLNLVSEDEIFNSQIRENESKIQLENYKMFNFEEDDEEEENDDNSSVFSNEIENNHEELQIKDTEILIPLDKCKHTNNSSNTINIISGLSFVDDDHNDSVAGSDDPNEKNSNWSGSNDDSHSSNHDSSLTGGTSRDEHSLKSSTQSNNHEKNNNRNNGNLTKKQNVNKNIKKNHQINDTQMLSFSFNHDNVKNTNGCNMNDVSNDCNIDMKDGIQIYQPPYNTNPHALEITSSDMKKRKFHLDNNKQIKKNSKNNFISKPSFNSNEVSKNNSSSNCHTNKEMLTNTNPNSSGSGTSSNECNWVTIDPKNGTKVSNNSSCSMSLDTEAVKAIALGCLPIDAVLRPRT